jgi:hypothetical protein
VSIWPAIVTVPVRVGPLVSDTLNATVDDPLPLAPEVIEIQSTLDAAVQPQSGLDAWTSTLPVPPVCGNEAEWAPRSNRHSAAVCVSCTRWSLMTTAAVRVAGSAFAAAAS